MADPNAQALLVYAAALAGAYVVYRWLQRPFLWVLGAAWRCVLGGAAVWTFDWLGSGLGLHVALNPATALVAGVLGLPGLTALVVLSN